MTGVSILSGVDIADFDADYQTAFIGAMEASLNNNSRSGAAVSVDSVEDAGLGTRRRLSAGGVRVLHDIRVVVEEYGEDADSIFAAIDAILQQSLASSALANEMNHRLDQAKGGGSYATSFTSIVNDEDGVVLTLLQSPAPSPAPTEDDGGDETTLIIIVVVVVAVVVALCGSIAAVFFCRFSNNMPSSGKYIGAADVAGDDQATGGAVELAIRENDHEKI